MRSDVRRTPDQREGKGRLVRETVELDQFDMARSTPRATSKPGG